MRTTMLACVMMSVSGVAAAGAPAGPDAINGAFDRMLRQSEAAGTRITAHAQPSQDAWIAERTGAVARGDHDPATAGFARMLARTHEAPADLPQVAAADPLATLVREALQAQWRAGPCYAAR